jgi:hypothetical protein
VWQAGDTIRRREVLNDGRCWLETQVIVVRDEPGLLASYLAPGARFRFPEGDWPTPTGRHPWHGRSGWEGHGTLMLQRPDEAHAIWVFWTGPEREFAGWYVNLQEPFRRTADGYDTQDLELDIWIPAGGRWEWKDADVLDERIREGRYTAAQVEATWAEGRRVAADLDAGIRWWDPWWALWEPEPEWDARFAKVSDTSGV